jgi:peptidyl-prolyl cis-trans isomerase SurA
VKRSWLLVPVLVGWTLGLARADLVNRVVATVDGDPITMYELESFIGNRSPELDRAGIKTKKDALDALITEKLLTKEIAAQKIAVRDEEIDHYIKQVRGQNRLSDKQLKDALEQEGVSFDTYRAQVKKEIEKLQLLNKEIRGRVNITPEDIERYYEAHKKDYYLSSRVRLRHIVLRLTPNAPREVVEATFARARELRKRLVDGKEEFAKLAKLYSEDAAAAQGGDLGEIDPAQVLPQFEAVLPTLQEAEVSQPIRTDVGVHLIQVEKRTAEGYRPVAAVSKEIKDKLYNEALEARYARWLSEDLKKRHYVEIKL